MTPIEALGFVRIALDQALGRNETPIKRLENREIVAGQSEMIRGDRRMPEQPSSGGLTKRVIINGIYYLYAEYNAAGEQSLDEAADRLEWALLDVQEGYVNDPNWYETRPLLLLPDGSQTAPISILDIPAERGGGVYALRLEFGIQIDVPRKK